MEVKGYLHADGRVRWVRDGKIGDVLYDEQRYNLRRVIVSRTWIVKLDSGQNFGAELRRDAVAEALAYVAKVAAGE